jgi:hypothetical protein
VAIDGEVAKEGGDLVLAHFAGVAFAMEKDEAAHPIDVGSFGSDAVTFDAEVPADAVQEFRRGCAGI